MHIKKNLCYLAGSFCIAIVAVSYSERNQKELLMPLRAKLVIPQKIIKNSGQIEAPPGMPLKQSKDGYYVNPWQASGIVFPSAVMVLCSDCGQLDADERSRLIDYGKFFADTAKIREFKGLKFAVWPYPINFTYGLYPGWISGMAQANIAVVLAAVSQCLNDSSFESLARLAINSFKVSVANGGVLVEMNDGYWFEEYAQAEVAPPLVLNGHVYATLALKNLQAFDLRSRELYMKGVKAVAGNIQHYDAITWCYYDRVGTPANNYYQKLHARQMLELYNATGNEKFLHFHNRFSAQLLSPFSALQRFIIQPSVFLGVLILINCATIFFIIQLILYAKKKWH